MRQKIVPLSKRTREIILGSLLGDGSLKIHRPYKNARFSFRHSVRQKEYFWWKANLLKEVAGEKSVFIQKNDGGFSKNPKLRFQSKAMESLTDLYQLTHKKGKLNIRRKWLNMMGPLALAIWWQDDGSIIANGRKGVFCTDGFDEKPVKIISRYLKKVWGIKTKVSPIRKKKFSKKEKYFRLYIHSTEDLKKFFRTILPHIHVPEMLTKVTILYRDNQLQQRWISEAAKISSFSEAIISQIVEKKKRKWRKYSEKDIVQSL